MRTDLHLARKAYHLFGVFIIIGLYQVLTREQGMMTIAVAAPLIILLDFIRLRIPAFNRLIYKAFGVFLRKEEQDKYSGMSYLLAGVFVVIAFFPKNVGLLALIFLAIGDPFASVIGILYGKDKILGNKSLQGTIAAFVICTFIAIIYFVYNDLMTERIILASLIAGVIGAISELVPVGKLDDNFTIPVLGASLLLVLFYYFGAYT